MSTDDMIKMIVKSTKEQIRQSFADFKKAAFPDATKDALDYNTVCLIEDEFRKQEGMCVKTLEDAYETFTKDMEAWVQKMEDTMNRFVKISTNVMGGFVLDSRRHSFTYDVDPRQIPAWKMDALMEEMAMAHRLMMEKLDEKKNRVHRTWDKFRYNLRSAGAEAEKKFNATLEQLISTDLTNSHKQVENLIHQNYLQRQGANHGMN